MYIRALLFMCLEVSRYNLIHSVIEALSHSFAVQRLSAFLSLFSAYPVHHSPHPSPRFSTLGYDYEVLLDGAIGETDEPAAVKTALAAANDQIKIFTKGKDTLSSWGGESDEEDGEKGPISGVPRVRFSSR